MYLIRSKHKHFLLSYDQILYAYLNEAPVLVLGFVMSTAVKHCLRPQDITNVQHVAILRCFVGRNR